MAGLLGMLGASARNLGQVGKNYGRIAKGRGADLLKSNPEYAIGAGLAGVAGGSIAHGISQGNEQDRIKQYQGLRRLIKESTGGLGGLVYNKDKDEFILTYAGTVNNAIKGKHMGHISSYIRAANEKLDIKVSDRVSFMSKKKSEEMNKTIRSSLKTEEGREKLSGVLNRQMSDPYAKDYGAEGKDPFGFGVPR